MFVRMIPVLLAAMTLGAYFAVLAIDPDSARNASLGLVVAMGAWLVGQSWLEGRR